MSFRIGRLAILVVGLLLAGCSGLMPAASMDNMSMAGAPADLDYAVERQSDQGLFTVRYASELDPVSINEVHAWTLHVETADGQPVDGAVIAVDGGMPEHNHGMPTQPEVTENLGDGNYRVEGMKFQMPGLVDNHLHDRKRRPGRCGNVQPRPSTVAHAFHSLLG